MKTIGYAVHHAGEELEPWTFERRAPRENDVVMEILYAGICHSDLHQVKNDWGFAQYPMVPGHEIVGRVIEVGSAVTKIKVGDAGAVGCLVDSCQHCDQCRKGHEQFCREGATPTYAGNDRLDGTLTQGGYSKHIVVREEFVCNVPEGMDLSRAAPIVCAGITTWSPLRKYNVGPTTRVGVVGMGGLGHMAAKLAKALGATVTMLSRSDAKRATAFEIGADDFIVSTDSDAMAKAAGSLDFIIDTVPVTHEMDPYISLLDVDGTLCIVGVIGQWSEVDGMGVLFGNRQIVGSQIGGLPETQEVLDFCGRQNILPECRIIRPDQINEAYETLEKSDIPYRFVIDMSALEVPANG